MPHKLDKYYLKKYGISWAQRMARWKHQGGCCALCGKHERSFKRRLAVDHNHASKKNRALVCYYCNFHRIGKLNLHWAKLVYEYMVKYDG